MDQEALAPNVEDTANEHTPAPPVALVKTWVTLANSKEDKMVRDHATKMLLTTFGDLKHAAEFCKVNGIRIN